MAQAAMHSGNPHERQPNFRHRKKKENRKTERGEFITPPRPTGRRSNKMIMTSNITHVPNAESEKKMTENGYTPSTPVFTN